MLRIALQAGRKLAPDEGTVAKTAFFAKIYTSHLRLLTGATFQNFLTLITCFCRSLCPEGVLHMVQIECGLRNAEFKNTIQNLRN